MEIFPHTIIFSYMQVAFIWADCGRVMALRVDNVQCRFWILVGQGPNVLAVGVGGVVRIFFSVFHITENNQPTSMQLYALTRWCKQGNFVTYIRQILH